MGPLSDVMFKGGCSVGATWGALNNTTEGVMSRYAQLVYRVLCRSFPGLLYPYTAAHHMSCSFRAHAMSYTRTCGIHANWVKAPVMTLASTCNELVGNVTFVQFAGFCAVKVEFGTTV
jgi:hypothetical protein